MLDVLANYSDFKIVDFLWLLQFEEVVPSTNAPNFTRTFNFNMISQRAARASVSLEDGPISWVLPCASPRKHGIY